MRPAISVVMTVYNQEEYLREAIDSVLAQEGADFELILVDDGSTDGSAGVAQSYGDRVRYLWRENGGLGAARNTGIEASRGEYVTFCDSDDIHLPFRLAAQKHVLDRLPRAALVFSELSPYRDGKVVSENLLRSKVMGPLLRSFDEEIEAAFLDSATAKSLGVPVPEQYGSRRVRWGRVPGLIALMHVAWGGASMYRRAALSAMGGHDESLRRYVDWELSSRLSKAYELAFLDVPVILYRLHGGQLTKKSSLGAQCYREVIEKVWRSDPVAYAQHHEVIDRCLGSARWSLGQVAAQDGDWPRAAEHYLASVRTYPKQKQVYLDLIKSWAMRLFVSSTVGR
jgi:glycosyltransferase involved in cell wall biosynthesis